MPVTLVDRLPLPSLRVYTAGSVVLVSMAMWHAVSVTGDPAWKVNATQQQAASDLNEASASLDDQRNITEQAADVVTFMLQEPLCMWTLINMCYCSVAVLAMVVQRAVFGSLRAAEAARVRDRFWNYVFYKFIFVFGVLNVQYMDEVVTWCGWFTVIGLLHLMAQLAKDRFQYLSMSVEPVVGAGSCRVVCLCGAVCMFGVALMSGAGVALLPDHVALFAFCAAECVLVSWSSLHVVARYVLCVRDVDPHGPLAYYTHLVFDTVSVCVELCHVSHMVWSHRLAVSLPSLVLLLQLRHLLHRLHLRHTRHKRYTTTHQHMTTHYPMASREEVDKNQDNCAICWEPMREARKLPCQHLFHNSCLCQWMQQDASCPTCRRLLRARPQHQHTTDTDAAGVPGLPGMPGLPPAPDRLFHFDGSRYVSWLPSFSVEVTRVRAPAPPALHALALQVHQMFPHYSLEVLSRDLAATRSADLTVHNILEGRLPPPTPQAPPPDAASHPAPSSPSHPAHDVRSVEQFPSSAVEREMTLQRRKDMLLANARARYLTRQTETAAAEGGAGAGPAPHS